LDAARSVRTPSRRCLQQRDATLTSPYVEIARHELAALIDPDLPIDRDAAASPRRNIRIFMTSVDIDPIG
jgi:hypothetical protein